MAILGYMALEYMDRENRFSKIVVALYIAIVFSLSTLPTLLYQKYAETFHFSELTVTIIYALYVVGTISTLLFLGRLSDSVGRHRIALPAIGVVALAALIFIFANNTYIIGLARVVSGFGIGLSAGAAIAWLRDLHGHNQGRAAMRKAVTMNILGLGLGPILSGVLLGFGPWRLRLTYIAYLLLLLPLAILTWRATETVQGRQQVKLSLLKPSIGVPAKLRLPFVAPSAIAFAVFSLTGFYSAIIPKLLVTTLHIQNQATDGLIIFLLFLAGVISVYVTGKLSSRNAMLTGAALMLPALAILVAAEMAASILLLLISTTIGGIALGVGYRGSLEVINLLSPVEKRAAMVSAMFIAGNLGISIPIIGIGIVATISKPLIADIIFAGVLMLFAVTGLVVGTKIKVDDSSS